MRLKPLVIPFLLQADTMSELKRNVREAVHCHFDESKAPSVIRLHMVKDEVIPV
jgi:hypothetical protein